MSSHQERNPLRTAFAELLRFGAIVFSLTFISRNLLVSLHICSVTSSLSSNVLFNIHEFAFSAVCLFFFPVVDIYFIALWSEKILDTISIFLNLLKLDLWPKVWTILENVPCAFEKKVCSSAFGWKVMKISIRPI